ncbi:MAG: CapA family protein [Clostridia bacterium]
MTKKLFAILLIAAMCLTMISLSIAQEEDGDVSITLLDKKGNVVTGTEGAAPEAGETATPAPTADKAEPIREIDGSILLTMSFTGDVTIGSNTQAGSSIFEKELKKQKGDINFPFRNVKEIFALDDLTMVNFEGTLTTEGKNSDKLENEYLFRADPSYVSMLPYGNIDTVSLENNHVLDMGAQGIAETKKTLTDAGISYASDGEPAVILTRGVKVGSLAYQTFGGKHDELIAQIPGDIKALRDQGCEVVVVSFHWGNEKDYSPNSNQVKLGRATIDAGADLVIGHHSHRINPIEYYNGKYICYSLGNFSFAGNANPSDMATFIFQIKMRVKDGVATSEQIKIIPCRISSRRDYNDFAPTPYDKDENIEAVVNTLKKNGKGLEYALTEYPIKWVGEE